MKAGEGIVLEDAEISQRGSGSDMVGQRGRPKVSQAAANRGEFEAT